MRSDLTHFAKLLKIGKSSICSFAGKLEFGHLGICSRQFWKRRKRSCERVDIRITLTAPRAGRGAEQPQPRTSTSAGSGVQANAQRHCQTELEQTRVGRAPTIRERAQKGPEEASGQRRAEATTEAGRAGSAQAVGRATGWELSESACNRVGFRRCSRRHQRGSVQPASAARLGGQGAQASTWAGVAGSAGRGAASARGRCGQREIPPWEGWGWGSRPESLVSRGPSPPFLPHTHRQNGGKSPESSLPRTEAVSCAALTIFAQMPWR